jgi:hypothetical protein
MMPPITPANIKVFGIERYALPKKSFAVFMKAWKFVDLGPSFSY